MSAENPGPVALPSAARASLMKPDRSTPPAAVAALAVFSGLSVWSVHAAYFNVPADDATIQEAVAAAAAISGGWGNSVEGAYGSIGGGYRNSISQEASCATIPGGLQAKASNNGQLTHASGGFGGSFGSAGEAQTSVFVLRRETTNNLPNELFLDGEEARITLIAKSTWTFGILVTARSEAGQSAGYQLRGVIQRDAADNTSLISAPSTTVLAEQNAAWNVTVEADDTAEALVVKVTGSPSEPGKIRWVATVRTSEVVF